MGDAPSVFGYGTHRKAVKRILQGGFKPSRNTYDWLGDAVYFFQDAPQRPWEWAVQLHGEEDARVLRAKILLRDCMDLFDIEWFGVLNDAYNGFMAQLKRGGHSLPRQTRGAHRLDRHVINYAVGVLGQSGVRVRSVRAAFAEGAPVFPCSALLDRAHVQIAVRCTEMIADVELVKSPGGLWR